MECGIFARAGGIIVEVCMSFRGNIWAVEKEKDIHHN